MFKKKVFVIIAFVCILSLQACNMSSFPAANATNPEPTDSAVIQTQVALIGTATSAAKTVVALSAAGTQSAMPTNTPEFAFTPSMIPSTPTVNVSTDTNCRSGPGVSYAIVGLLKVGKTAEVVGQTGDGGFWIIRLPTDPTVVCWLWSGYATVSGDWKALPVVTPPPLSTQEASFTTSYVEIVTCENEYALTFKIVNSGSITWNSIKIVLIDTDKNFATTHTGTSFKQYSGCKIVNDDKNLGPGEIGYVTTMLPGQFKYNPSGHNLTATVTVCSMNSLAGTCLSKTVSFIP